jgi:hypothetical protein
MARKRQTNAHEWRLKGQGKTLTRMLPTDDGGVALSWATNVLMYRAVDGEGRFAREGEEMPCGDYVLSLVGPLKTEDHFEIRKHIDGNPVLSWRDA